MKGLFAPEQRRIRIDVVMKTILESKATYNFIVYDKFVYDIQIRWGLTEPKAKEYIDLAMKGCDAHVVNGEIVFVKTQEETNVK